MMSPEDEIEYRHLWDGTEDWALSKSDHDRLALTIHFVGCTPTVRETIALRKLLTEYQHLPPAQLKQTLGEADTLELNPMDTSAARLLLKRGSELGLRLTAQEASYTGYLPVNPTLNLVMIIEDDALAQEVTDRMLDAGVHVIEC